MSSQWQLFQSCDAILLPLQIIWKTHKPRMHFWYLPISILVLQLVSFYLRSLSFLLQLFSYTPHSGIWVQRVPCKARVNTVILLNSSQQYKKPSWSVSNDSCSTYFQKVQMPPSYKIEIFTWERKRGELQPFQSICLLVLLRENEPKGRKGWVGKFPLSYWGEVQMEEENKNKNQ